MTPHLYHTNQTIGGQEHQYKTPALPCIISGPFYSHDLTLSSVWIGNYIRHKVWAKIADPFTNFNGAVVSAQLWRPLVSKFASRVWPSPRLLYTLGEKVVTPRNEVPFGRLFKFYPLARSKGRLVGRIYGFSVYCMHYFAWSCLSV